VTGVLQHENRVDIEDLLDPPEESWMMEQSTDKEIYQAVMATWKEWEGGDISGGDDDDQEEGTPEPYPTYCEIFQAVSTLV